MKINAPMKQEQIISYTNIVTSLANMAIMQTEGASYGDIGTYKKTPRNVGVFIDAHTKTVIIDVYIDVVFGYNVSHVACNLQEEIIKQVKKNTPLTVKQVNINIISVIFN